MSGYVCIAMLEDPPYNLYLAATEEEPEDWCAGLPLSSHLLCCEGFKDPQAIVKLYIQKLKEEGITAKANKAFPAQPHELLRSFFLVRDAALRQGWLDDSGMTQLIDDDEDAGLGEQYFEHAQELELDDENRLALMKKAAEAGYRPAIDEVIDAYYMGWGCEENLEEAVDWVIDKDIRLDGNQLNDLAERFDLEDANRVRLLKMAAEAGYNPAIAEVIEAYKFGWGCEENLEEAVDWIIQNNIEMADEALEDLAKEFDIEDEGRFKLLKWRAEAGNSEAIVETAEAYYNGWGTEESYQQSLYWADQARADEIDAEKKMDLASLYDNLAMDLENGDGDFLEDPKKARIVYKKAHSIYLFVANEDSFNGSRSCLHLAFFYMYGNGVRKDLNECIKWSLKAGEKGNISGFLQAGDVLLDAGKRTQAEGVWKRYFEVLRLCCDDYRKCRFLIPEITGRPYGKTYKESVDSGAISPIHTLRDVATLEKLVIAMKSARKEAEAKGESFDEEQPKLLADFLKWMKSTLAKV